MKKLLVALALALAISFPAISGNISWYRSSSCIFIDPGKKQPADISTLIQVNLDDLVLTITINDIEGKYMIIPSTMKHTELEGEVIVNIALAYDLGGKKYRITMIEQNSNLVQLNIMDTEKADTGVYFIGIKKLTD